MLRRGRHDRTEGTEKRIKNMGREKKEDLKGAKTRDVRREGWGTNEKHNSVREGR